MMLPVQIKTSNLGLAIAWKG